MTHFTPTIRLQNKNPCLNLFLEKGSKINIKLTLLLLKICAVQLAAHQK